MSANYHLDPALLGKPEAVCFASLDAVFALTGERVAQAPLSVVLRVEIDGRRYYVKRYSGNGKNLPRRWFGFRQWLVSPRLCTERRNLLAFAEWGIPTARVGAYGIEQCWGGFRRGVLITYEIPDSIDLAKLAHHQDVRLRDKHWVAEVSAQVARITRTMHAHGFVHNDLKWRNLLVTRGDKPTVYLIDCPWGGVWWGPFLGYRVIKDLACLDKLAKHHLSQTQRLRFYLDYAQRHRLEVSDKRRIRKILSFFEGRE
jgi:thiamine kinase-like enzyme